MQINVLPPDAVICQECFLLLKEHCRRGNMEVVRELGNTHVCLGCGRSVLDIYSPSVRHNSIEANDPLIAILCSWNPLNEVLSRCSFAYHLCWMCASQQILRDQNRKNNIECELATPEQQAVPVPPNPPAALKNRV